MMMMNALHIPYLQLQTKITGSNRIRFNGYTGLRPTKITIYCNEADKLWKVSASGVQTYKEKTSCVYTD